MSALVEDLKAFIDTLPEARWYETTYDERAGLDSSRKPFVFLRVLRRNDALHLVFGLRKNKSSSTIDSLDDSTKQSIVTAYETIRDYHLQQ